MGRGDWPDRVKAASADRAFQWRRELSLVPAQSKPYLTTPLGLVRDPPQALKYTKPQGITELIRTEVLTAACLVIY